MITSGPPWSTRLIDVYIHGRGGAFPSPVTSFGFDVVHDRAPVENPSSTAHGMGPPGFPSRCRFPHVPALVFDPETREPGLDPAVTTAFGQQFGLIQLSQSGPADSSPALRQNWGMDVRGNDGVSYGALSPRLTWS
jgi:hypothetical protein